MDGGLLVHLGGDDYYKISMEDIKELIPLTHKYLYETGRQMVIDRDRINMEESKMVMKVRSGIFELGEKVPYEHLPAALKMRESLRQEAVEDMKGNIIE